MYEEVPGAYASQILATLPEAEPHVFPETVAVTITDNLEETDPIAFEEPSTLALSEDVSESEPGRLARFWHIARHSGEKAIRAVVAGASLGAVTGQAISVATAPAAAAAAPTMPPNANLMAGQLWMIKDNDLAVIGNVGEYEWVGCGESTAPQYANNPAMDYTKCSPGQAPIYTNYNTLTNDINSGNLASGSTIIFDDEPWVLTPSWERASTASQIQYQTLAIKEANAHGIKVIATPADPKVKNMIKEDVAAAQAGAYAIDIQAQAQGSAPNGYANLVDRDASKIRAANPNVLVLAGLATDPIGVPMSVNHLLQSYSNVKNNVNGFWLNADVRPSGKGCSPKGCPATADTFLKDIGATS